MPQIVVERGNEKGVSLKFDAPEKTVVIGRLKTCDLVLTDGLASRQHFSEIKMGDRFKIKDLNSHNGTFLNGEKITTEEIDLPLGATVRAGETLFSFRSDSQTSEGGLTGKKIAGYHLVARVGVGGMGEVYKAMQI